MAWRSYANVSFTLLSDMLYGDMVLCTHSLALLSFSSVELAAIGLFIWTGYALLVERIYATWRVDTYERVHGNGFLVGWAVALLSIGVLLWADTMRQKHRVIGSVAICAGYGSITFNILAYFALNALYSYNKKRYLGMLSFSRS
jgi:multisubunit Na+/H+ antiporter MnhG subunit